MPKGSWAYIQFVERPGRPGGPVDPGWGVEGPETQPPGVWPGPGYPDQGLPGGGWGGGLHPGNRPPGSFPGRPDQGLPWPGRPVDPGWGVGSEYPDQGLPGRPPHVWPRPPGGGLPVDPSWGVGAERPSHGLPIHPIGPGHPDNTLPPVEGIEPPPVDPPPGTVWPPLPPGVDVSGKAIVLAAIQGVGYRYVVVEIGTHPDQGLPSTPEAQPKSRRG